MAVIVLRIMGCPFTGNAHTSRKAREMEHLSLWVLYEGTLEGGSFPGYPEGYIEGSGDGHIFS